MFLCSMQCAKHEVDNVFVAGFIIQLCTDMAADIGHFNPFYAIMHQLGSHVNIVYSEHAFLHSFAQYIFEPAVSPWHQNAYVPSLPPMSRKKLARSVPITEYHLFHCIQTRVYHFNHLLVRRYILLRHTLHHVRKHIQFRFDNSHINYLPCS